METEIVLGSEVKDSISGMKGIVVGIVEYLFSEGQYQVAPVESDGKADASGDWFPKKRILYVGSGISLKQQ